MTAAAPAAETKPILPGSGACPKDEQFPPVQQPGFALWLQCATAAALGTAAGLAGGGLTPMDQVALYF